MRKRKLVEEVREMKRFNFVFGPRLGNFENLNKIYDDGLRLWKQASLCDRMVKKKTPDMIYERNIPNGIMYLRKTFKKYSVVRRGTQQ